MRLEELVRGIPGVRVAAGDPSTRICDLTEDSRTSVPGSLFVARPGLKADGRAHVRDAVSLGAVAVLTDAAGAAGMPSHLPMLVADDVPLAAARLAERFYGEPTGKLTLIGVTGTNGKTTFAHLVHQILNHAGLRCGLIGTVEIDDGFELAPAEMTTPPAIELSRTLGCMVEAGCAAAVMEVSSHALDQRRADALRFSVAAFTNLTGDHLDYHGSMDRYAGAKRRLFELLGRDGEPGLAVLNAEDAWSAAVAGAGERRAWCAEGPAAENAGDPAWRIEPLALEPGGQRVRIAGPGIDVEGAFALPGRHNRMNLLQAVAAATEALRLAGRPLPVIERLLRAALPTLRPPRGRLELIGAPDDPAAVYVDFAHTDDGLRKALEALRPLVPEGASLRVVFGAGGNKDASKRPRMGRVAGELADHVVITSDNPRREAPHQIAAEILAGIPPNRREAASVEVDRARAIRLAIDAAADAFAQRAIRGGRGAPRDVVLIAGKGHETEQISCDARGNLVSRRFVDQEEAAAALAEARSRLARSAAIPAAVGGSA